MMQKANMSMCLIVKNEPFLEKCILSFRDYVEELVIVDTGSTDGTTVEIAKKYADIFEVYTDCNDPETGLIADFSMARNRSFALATKPFVGWIDSDDTLSGAENFIKIIENVKNNETVAFMFPYEYSYNELGQCICLHYRERLVSNKEKFKWTNPVHEVLVPKDNESVQFITDDSVIWKHQRQFNPKQVESGRNLRILKKYLEKVGDTDARQLYYIGLEYHNNGLIEEAINHLSKYVDLSGWDDERAMACLKLIEIYQAKGDYENGLKWGFKTIAIKENWGEGYFGLAKMFYHLAEQKGPNEWRNWERCAHFAKLGLSQPLTKTLLFVNPLDRSYDIHRYLNMALNKLGDVNGALNSATTALQAKPNDEALLINKKLYQSHLIKQNITNNINELKDLGEIDQNIFNTIQSIINKQMSIDKLNNNVIPLSLVWNVANQFKKNGHYVKNCYNDIENEDKLFTETYLELFSDNINKLDIVFFIGQGVEQWTPHSVNKTGIGGSELMAIELSKRLAGLGHKVRVYAGSDVMNEGIYDGVEYRTSDKYKDLTCDVLIVSRRADMLGDQYNIAAKLKLLWIHDVCAINATNELLLKADKILCLTEWHKQNVMNAHNLHESHIITTRNGIDLERFNKNIIRDRFKCVNFSSPDRSWPILLSVWHRIKARVPQATLTLGYGFKNWEFAAQHDKLQQDLIQRLKDQIKDLEPLGVRYLDRVNQQQVAEEYLSAGVLLYPTWFTESSYIGGMEAQAAGVRIVSSSIAALNETVGDRGLLIDGEWTSQTYQDAFVEGAVNALLYEGDEDRKELQEYAKEHFCLNKLAKSWQEMFYNLMEVKKINPVVLYRPTKAYQ